MFILELFNSLDYILAEPGDYRIIRCADVVYANLKSCIFPTKLSKSFGIMGQSYSSACYGL